MSHVCNEVDDGSGNQRVVVAAINLWWLQQSTHDGCSNQHMVVAAINLWWLQQSKDVGCLKCTKKANHLYRFVW